ncbi:hypothetical protein C8Q76DRAFT_570374, partial [Earliella scabrosa]
MSSQITDTLNHWKTRRFRKSDIPLSRAITSLKHDPALIEVKRTGKSEWVFCAKGTDTPAVFSTSAVFASSDPYDTGNLVPPDPSRQSDSQQTRTLEYASHKCYYAYCFDTSIDNDLYTAQDIFEEHIIWKPDFNPRCVPRRGSQSGVSTQQNRFWMRTPMFVRRTRGEGDVPCPAHIHDWVRKAAETSTMYRPNPARPVIRAVENGRLKDIENAHPNYLQFGDAVALTFMVAYIEGRFDWYPQYHVVDIVRVEASDSDEFGRFAIPTIDTSARAALCEGELVD